MADRFGARQTARLDSGSEFASAFALSGAMLGLDGDRVWIGWGEQRSFQRREEAASAGASAALYAPDFYLKRANPWIVFQNWDVVQATALTSAVRRWLEAGEDQTPRVEWREPEFSDFARAFGAVQERIADGRLQKAVPVSFALGAFVGGESIAMATVARALAAPAQLRPYGVWGVSPRPWGTVGASPETLFRQPTPTSLVTAALAGTRARTEDPVEIARFLNDPKERAEHEFVVDDLRRTLARRGSVHVGEIAVARLPTLLHLQTPIEVELSSSAMFEDLAADLHPTPALGVAPRSAGLAALREIDDGPERGRFGAPFGVWAEDPFISHCLVAIRCAQWSDGSIAIGAGCGVVAASRLESEWAEMRAKRESVKGILGL